jgi:hypothetical protein
VWACLSLPKTNCWTQSTTDADHPSYGVQNEVSAPSVKQQLAAVRMLFDWLVIGQVVPTNPAAAVRGPKHGLCHGNERRLGRGARPSQSSRRCNGVLPLRCRFGSEDPQRQSGDEVPLKVEIVVNGGVHAEKVLGRSG